jgi:soluble lytic murein transglycosylase-like protein
VRQPALAHCHGFPGAPSRRVASPGVAPRGLLWGAVLLLLGFVAAAGAHAADLLQPLNPGGAGRGPQPCQARGVGGEPFREEAGSDGQPLAAAPADAAGFAVFSLPTGAFCGFADTLPTAAEPPPAGDAAAPAPPAAAAAPAIPAGAAPATAAGPDATATPAGSGADGSGAPPASAAPSQPESSPPPPPPQPLPSLGFDPGSGVPQTRFGKMIYQIASHYSLNPRLMAAMIEVESAFNPRARSRKGALGLMQMLPATARRFGVARRRDLYNPRKNLEVASRYLRWLIDRFGEDPVSVVAAYNAGEGAVDRFGGVPPYVETRDYVQRIFAQLGVTLLLDAPLAAETMAVVGTK